MQFNFEVTRMETESPERSETEENTEETEANFAVSLDILDNYELPTLEADAEAQEEETGKPVGKKRRLEDGVGSAARNRKPRGVLGDDYREQEERRLEQLLFGKLLLEKTQTSHEKESRDAVDNDSDEASDESNIEEESADEQEVLPSDKFGKALGLHSSDKKKPAWTDVDDETIKLKDVVATYKRGAGRHGSKETSETNYSQILKKNFATAHGHTDTPKWAHLDRKNEDKKKPKRSLSDSEEDAEDDSLLRTAGNFLQSKTVALPQGFLSYKPLKDVNQMTRAEGAVILGVEFHRRDNVALVAGLPGIVSLFQVDGRTNSKIQTVHFDNFPISCAHFSSDGDEFLATSRRLGHINVYNMVSGKVSVIPHNKNIENGTMKFFVPSPDGKVIAFQGRFGYVHLMSAKSKEWITSLKMNGNVQALTFSPDGSRLYTHGEFGEVYVWDMNTRQCVHKFQDEGCIAGTSIAVSPSQQYIACGSGSGVVNVYETASLENQMTPKPAKVLLNLVTSVNSLKFHPSSEMLCMASSVKEHAVRMVHLPSLTVFQNFPNLQNKSISQVKCCDFSPNGGYLAFGNDRGSAKLYRLPHYAEY